MALDYYIKRYKIIDSKVPTTVMITDAWYTIHGNCSLSNVDVNEWVIDTDEFQCDIGFYYLEEDIFTDWITVRLKY